MQNVQEKNRNQWRANLEEALAAAMELHAEADAAGLTGAGKLGQQGSQDGAGQGLLQRVTETSGQLKVQQALSFLNLAVWRRLVVTSRRYTSL